MSESTQDRGERLVATLSALPLPDDGPQVEDADSLLEAIVNGSDKRGRYFADPRLLRRLFWWEETSPESVAAWIGALSDRNEIVVGPYGRSCYTDATVEILQIVNRQRFPRFYERAPIPPSVRQAVYDRDGWRCLHCGARDQLSLDHMIPWSKGGGDEPENLQTLCRPCNSRKGAKY